MKTKIFVFALFVILSNSALALRMPGPSVAKEPKIAVRAAKVDPRLDRHLIEAARITEEKARGSRRKCWRGVKTGLLLGGAVPSYPGTENACEAGKELTTRYGFRKLPVRDPESAPVGAVLVYSTTTMKGAPKAGHVEIRTKNGFASDFRSKTAYHGVFEKVKNRLVQVTKAKFEGAYAKFASDVKQTVKHTRLAVVKVR
jgi:hypothetical protein